MAIITLTSDFGLKDHFTGATKGAIYSELPDVNIVDISHNVSPFSIPEAAYIIQNAYSSFPEGTIHIIGIDSEINPRKQTYCGKTRWALFYLCQQWDYEYDLLGNCS
ncbi:hypothetical protein JCM19274_2322 [Algibacter lectus]|uniref:S-adenosyl-l-methionine hydroxide adenosyltransferase N-terminal domain-containing protein n=1 Tax=Algibacter lectus TaxID=221126 RepID=A0A090X013_9FLAO|nr:hypothetical protein JCM19274_2322 [Algibacter lectus]